MNWFHLLIGLLVAIQVDSKASFQASPATPTCLDEDGKPVDWFIVYKNPQIGKEEPFSTGYVYAYITSEDVHSAFEYSGKKRSRGAAGPRKKDDGKLRWTISSRLLTEPNSMVQKTLQIAYDKKNKRYDSLNAILYNDAPPENPNGKNINSNSRAHAKGAILIDDVSGDGLWLIHSVSIYSERSFADNRHNSDIPTNIHLCSTRLHIIHLSWLMSSNFLHRARKMVKPSCA